MTSYVEKTLALIFGGAGEINFELSEYLRIDRRKNYRGMRLASH